MTDRKLSTWRVKWPFGATLALAVGILLCLVVISEFLLRRANLEKYRKNLVKSSS